MRRGLFAMGAAALGAGLAYLLDPDRGKLRRHKTKDRLAAVMRRRRRELGQKARYVGGQMEGVGHRMTGAGQGQVPADDRTLESKIQSEVLGGDEFGDASINVMVADGIVDLRGELRTPDDINRLEAAVAAVPGVQRVDNHVRLPNTANSGR